MFPKMPHTVFTALFLTLLTLAPARAQTSFDAEHDVVAWAGAGPHTAFVAIDFDASTTDSAEFVFGVNFTSDTITGEEALNLIIAETNLEATSTTFPFGKFIDTFTYTRYGITYTAGGPGLSAYWSYWHSTDYGAAYDFATSGIAERRLADGDMDAYQYLLFSEITAGPNGPRHTLASTFGLETTISEWVGAGDRTAFVVVDFSASTSESAQFHFGVHFDAPWISGAEALDRLIAETSLEVTSTTFPFGTFIDSITYVADGTTWTATASAGDNTYWSYWWSRDLGYTYGYGLTGIGERQLHDGDTDAFQFLNYSDSTSGPNGPFPEPHNTGALSRAAVEWAGAGDRQAFVVIDFDKSSTQPIEFVFGIRFDAVAISGQEALELLIAETSLEVTSTTFPFGTFIDSFTYERDAVVYTATGSAATSTYWSAWWSRNLGTSYGFALVGMAERQLHHADIDGYQYLSYSDFTNGPNGPRYFAPVETAARRWRLYQ